MSETAAGPPRLRPRVLLHPSARDVRPAVEAALGAEFDLVDGEPPTAVAIVLGPGAAGELPALRRARPERRLLVVLPAEDPDQPAHRAALTVALLDAGADAVAGERSGAELAARLRALIRR